MNRRSIIFSLITVLMISSANIMPIQTARPNSSNTDNYSFAGYTINKDTIKKGTLISAGLAAAGYCIYSWIAHRKNVQISLMTAYYMGRGYTKDKAAYFAQHTQFDASFYQ